MFKFLNQKKAQSTLEYAVLIGVLVAGLIAMQVYLKRGFQGKMRESADSMGQQFSPAHTTYNYTTVSKSKSSEGLLNGVTTTNIQGLADEDGFGQVTRKKGSENVAAESGEKWW